MISLTFCFPFLFLVQNVVVVDLTLFLKLQFLVGPLILTLSCNKRGYSIAFIYYISFQDRYYKISSSIIMTSEFNREGGKTELHESQPSMVLSQDGDMALKNGTQKSKYTMKLVPIPATRHSSGRTISEDCDTYHHATRRTWGVLFIKR